MASEPSPSRNTSPACNGDASPGALILSLWQALGKRRLQRGEDLGPAFAGAVGVVCPVGVQLVRQGEFAASAERRDVDCEAAHVRLLAGRTGAPGEGETAWTIELQVFAGVVDLLALAADEE